MKKIGMYSYILLLLSISPTTHARTIKILLASTNNHKLATVRSLFQDNFAHDTITCITHKSSSMIPEQPLGKEVALKGAQNRIANLPQDLVTTADYIVAIENYIEKSPYTHTWQDRGLVLLQNISSQLPAIITTTQPTRIPDHFIHLAQQACSPTEITTDGYSVTIGQMITQTSSHVDPHDWHRESEFGGISRSRLLYDALFKALHASTINSLKQRLVMYPDFPKPGIIFADFLPILSNATTFQTCINLLYERYKSADITAVVGLESRGFILGAALAHRLGIGFIPVRKPGKLPGPTHSITYQKEYGSDTLMISQSALLPNQRVLVIDDLIATGGSARATIELVKLAGGIPVEFVSLLQVAALAENLQLGIPTFNLID